MQTEKHGMEVASSGTHIFLPARLLGGGGGVQKSVANRQLELFVSSM